jgi:cytochrome c biogenesis protein CcdA
MSTPDGWSLLIIAMGIATVWSCDVMVRRAEKAIEASGAPDDRKRTLRSALAIYLGIVFVVAATGFGQAVGLGVLAFPAALLAYVLMLLVAFGWAVIDARLHGPRTVFGQARFADKRDEAEKGGLK